MMQKLMIHTPSPKKNKKKKRVAVISLSQTWTQWCDVISLQV